jgi:hypothetical protein
MEIEKLIERLKWMVNDLEKAKMAGITDATVRVLFRPSQVTPEYITTSTKYWHGRSLPLHFDYSIDITENKGIISMKIHEYDK